MNDTTGSRCCVPRCRKRPAATTLYGVPPEGGPYLFCDQCAPVYEAKGYRREPFPTKAPRSAA